MPQIDRKLDGPRKVIKGRLLATSIASAIVISLIATMLIATAPSEDNPARITYMVHNPILINDSADFDSQADNESWLGDGTPGTPYIIQGYDINASSADGISIKNSNVYFIIKDCYVHHGTTYYGISLFSCMNANLSNNDCSNNWVGIMIFFSDNNVLNDNNCSRNAYGMYIAGSNNIISNNNCSFNDINGICVTGGSSNDTLSNNICSNNDYGIYIGSSDGNALSNNNCSDNNQGIYLETSSNNNLSNNVCNSNNYNGINFQISSIGNTLSGNTCNWNIWNGISLFFSCDDNTFSDNNCSNNSLDGILIDSSLNNTLVWNLICNNSEYGINISVNGGGTADTKIWNNTLNGNNGAGSVYNPSNIQACDNGADNTWNSPSGYGNWWGDWTTPDDDPDDGIVDDPYMIDGTAGASDNFPLTDKPTPPFIPEFSDMLIPIVGLMLIALVFGRARKKLQS